MTTVTKAVLSVSVNSTADKKESFICKCRFVSIQSLNRAGTPMTCPVLVTWLFGWKQVLLPAVNVLAGWGPTCLSLQGSFEVDCSGGGVLSLGLPSAKGGSLVVLFCCWLYVYFWDRTLKPLDPQVERYFRLREWFHAGFLVWGVPSFSGGFSPKYPLCRSGNTLLAAAFLAQLLVARSSSRHSRGTPVPGC